MSDEDRVYYRRRAAEEEAAAKRAANETAARVHQALAEHYSALMNARGARA